MKPTVLIVEDDEDLRLGLRLRLETVGFTVREAGDAYFAVEAAQEFHPGVILLDIGLPGMNGYSVLERYQQQPDLAGIPVVVLTGRDPVATKEALADYPQVVQFLTKPVRNAVLEAALRLALLEGPDHA